MLKHFIENIDRNILIKSYSCNLQHYTLLVLSSIISLIIMYKLLKRIPIFKNIYVIQESVCVKRQRSSRVLEFGAGSVVSVSASRAVGRGFAPRPGHQKPS